MMGNSTITDYSFRFYPITDSERGTLPRCPDQIAAIPYRLIAEAPFTCLALKRRGDGAILRKRGAHISFESKSGEFWADRHTIHLKPTNCDKY
jgi:hypothetical protein